MGPGGLDDLAILTCLVREAGTQALRDLLSPPQPTQEGLTSARHVSLVTPPSLLSPTSGLRDNAGKYIRNY